MREKNMQSTRTLCDEVHALRLIHRPRRCITTTRRQIKTKTVPQSRTILFVRGKTYGTMDFLLGKEQKWLPSALRYHLYSIKTRAEISALRELRSPPTLPRYANLQMRPLDRFPHLLESCPYMWSPEDYWSLWIWRHRISTLATFRHSWTLPDLKMYRV